MKHYGLIGYPLAHSFSRNYFEDKFVNERIDASYSNFEISNGDDLLRLIKEYSLDGFNVTIPHKVNIIQYLNKISDDANEVGAVNCVTVRNNVLKGYNTDVFGFEKAILETTNLKSKKALIFGTGGSSRAVAFVLQKHNVPFKYVSRNDSYNGFSYADLNEEILNEYLLLINTTPVGMFPNIDDALPIPYQFVTKQHVAFDLIYNPEQTKFLFNCEMEGAMVQNGYNMLIYQAEESYRIFTQE
jgi:shikimate dehydrogenase